MSKGESTRHAVYRELFRYQLDPQVIDESRAATNGNYTLCSSQFKAQVAAKLGWRVMPGKIAAAAKNREPDSSDLFDADGWTAIVLAVLTKRENAGFLKGYVVVSGFIQQGNLSLAEILA